MDGSWFDFENEHFTHRVTAALKPAETLVQQPLSLKMAYSL